MMSGVRFRHISKLQIPILNLLILIWRSQECVHNKCRNFDNIIFRDQIKISTHLPTKSTYSMEKDYNPERVCVYERERGKGESVCVFCVHLIPIEAIFSQKYNQQTLIESQQMPFLNLTNVNVMK